jgi:hypothetical protein
MSLSCRTSALNALLKRGMPSSPNKVPEALRTGPPSMPGRQRRSANSRPAQPSCSGRFAPLPDNPHHPAGRIADAQVACGFDGKEGCITTCARMAFATTPVMTWFLKWSSDSAPKGDPIAMTGLPTGQWATALLKTVLAAARLCICCPGEADAQRRIAIQGTNGDAPSVSHAAAHSRPPANMHSVSLHVRAR